MPLNAQPLHPLFAAQLSGIDLRRRGDAAARAGIVAAMDRYAVCVFRHDVPLTDAASSREKEYRPFSGRARIQW